MTSREALIVGRRHMNSVNIATCFTAEGRKQHESCNDNNALQKETVTFHIYNNTPKKTDQASSSFQCLRGRARE
jgi:hypothetical protein